MVFRPEEQGGIKLKPDSQNLLIFLGPNSSISQLSLPESLLFFLGPNAPCLVLSLDHSYLQAVQCDQMVYQI